MVYFFLYESSNLSLESVDMVGGHSLRWRIDLNVVGVRCTLTLIANLGLPENGLRLGLRLVRIS